MRFPERHFMSIVIWALAGGILGWAACKYFRFNEDRGVMLAVVIGAAGGFVGGHMIAPMFLAPGAPVGFSMAALVFAAAVAALFIFVSNLVHQRWGV